MVWHRLLVRSTCTLRELHGVIRVAMGWEGIHLYQFCLRSGRYSLSELSASSLEVTVAALRLRKGAQFIYEYDLNISWRHEISIEDLLAPEMGKAYPVCTGGDGACPPDDCDGLAGFMAGRNAMLSVYWLEGRDTMAEIIGEAVLECRMKLLDDEDTRWRLWLVFKRSKARKLAQGQAFSRRVVNARLRRRAALVHGPEQREQVSLRRVDQRRTLTGLAARIMRLST